MRRPSKHRHLRELRAERSRLQAVAPPTPLAARSIDEALTDCAVYDNGEREGGVVPLTEALERAYRTQDGFVWIGLHDPEPAAVEALGAQFALHPLLVEDAIHAHQRPKLERHDGLISLVMKTAQYVDETEHVEVGELMVVVGPKFVVTVRHGSPVPLSGLREDLEQDHVRMERGPGAVFHAIVDRVVDEYADVLEGLFNDVDEVEATVFSDQRTNPTERIYRLKREVIAFKKAVGPLVHPLTRLVEDTDLPVPERARPYLRDVLDHLERDAEAVNAIDDVLSGVLDANLAQISLRQNEDARKISAWAAIAVVPTMIFGLYGMNFEHMPELKWHLGYPAVLLFTLAVCGGLYSRLRRAGWL
ncbi:magnesium and cobalt transport protein CorA [Patulibacter sp.]|uniref:magnesium and cobalt transport protein CorA n=1 Tax=Patulibacter sp. TaxID=1912859 RepID=UPI0027208F7B|nr:magnesium and cobalt transport protein CorA [Patulibacter sp.]MDO9407895.1 magnesium and cobalt transport protein CorA [Patulibacter sp.]